MRSEIDIVFIKIEYCQKPYERAFGNGNIHEMMLKIKPSIWLIILDNQLIILRIKYEYPKRISFHPRAKN